MNNDTPKMTVDPNAIAGDGIPSHFANAFRVSMNETFGKVALGEFMAGDPTIDTRYYHCFTMPTPQLINMAQAILNIAARMEAAAKLQQAGPLEVAKFSRKVN